jgi:hypothetical protein
VTPLEQLLLRGLLIEFASRFATAFHDRFDHADSLTPCTFSPMAPLSAWKSHDRDGLNGFVAWIEAFFTEFEQAHPRSSDSSDNRQLGTQNSKLEADSVSHEL